MALPKRPPKPLAPGVKIKHPSSPRAKSAAPTKPKPTPATPASKSSAWKAKLIRNKHGVEGAIANVVTILENEPVWQAVLAFDEFYSRIDKLKPPPWYEDDTPAKDLVGPWVDADATRVANWVNRAWETCKVSTIDVEKAVRVVADRHPIHVVRDWLNSLRWDGGARLDTWLIRHAGAEDSPYTRAVSTMFAIGAVARVMKPGCKVDHTLVLEGKTGKGKSSLLRALVGDEWFLETEMNLGDKEFFKLLRGKWIVELAELDSLSQGNLARVKAVLTKQVDTYRDSYGRHSQDYPRQCVFTGTTEEDTYLKDAKGNRRFWPVRTSGDLDVKGLHGARGQIWAESVVRYRKGEPWHLTDKSLLGLFEHEQEQRRQVDPWEPAIIDLLRGSRFRKGISTGQVMGLLDIPVRDQGRAEEMRVAAILHKLRWERRRVSAFGERNYVFTPVDEGAWRAHTQADVSAGPSGPSTPAAAPASVTNIVGRLRKPSKGRGGP